MKVWTQRVPCPSDIIYFARDSLRSYFHETQQNEIYFLNNISMHTNMSETCPTLFEYTDVNRKQISALGCLMPDKW